jgi:excinuclease ABC subunit C
LSRGQENKLQEKVRILPDEPGVYIMKDGKGRVIYVGKAKRLSHRVRSYFQDGQDHSAKTRNLVSAIRDIDYIATGNEVEALVLEYNLIKEYHPRYNIRLKDDKRYPFVKVTTNEPFPRIVVVRRVESDGAEYFGPYTDVKALRKTLRFLKTIFPLRNCSGGQFKTRDRECLNFHIERCLGPCTGNVSQDEYRALVRQVLLFLKGKNDELRALLEERMRDFAENRYFEDAAKVRDQMEMLGRISEQQLAVSPGAGDKDIVVLSREGDTACGVVMKIREDRLLATEAFLLPASSSETDSTLFESFLGLYYHSATDIPPSIVIQQEVVDRELIEEWLGQKRGGRVELSCPRRGEQRKLVELALKNASLKILSEAKPGRRSTRVLEELKQTLGLVSTPFLVEAFDISNIQGAEPVGSMVTFKDGEPFKSGYRHFKIRDVDGANDFAMLEEVLTRRLRHIREGKDRAPDLVMVDGGRGQVTAARKVMNEGEMASIPIIGLAKKHEEIYLETEQEPLRLSRNNAALKLLQRIRNEAHRFAIDYHRKLMRRRLGKSELDGIAGIGIQRKIALLVEFGSVEELRKATIDQIASVPGIGERIAETIHRHLRGRRP